MEWLTRQIQSRTLKGSTSAKVRAANTKKVFIVHGRDDKHKLEVDQFLRRLKLEPIVLHEQANKGRTIIQKFEDHADVGFAAVLLTPDDKGFLATDSADKAKPRARQNVILELGFFFGRIGKESVCPLYTHGVELPSDYDGVAYVELDAGGAWKMILAREMKAAGLVFDMNDAVA